MNGKGSFTALPVHESGLYLGKNLKDLELIEIKGVTYILGANNKSTMDLIRVNPSGLPAS